MRKMAFGGIALLMLMAALTAWADLHYLLSNTLAGKPVGGTFRNPLPEADAYLLGKIRDQRLWLINDTTNPVVDTNLLTAMRKFYKEQDEQDQKERAARIAAATNINVREVLDQRAGITEWNPDFDDRPGLLQLLLERDTTLKERLTLDDWDWFTNTARQMESRREQRSAAQKNPLRVAPWQSYSYVSPVMYGQPHVLNHLKASRERAGHGPMRPEEVYLITNTVFFNPEMRVRDEQSKKWLHRTKPAPPEILNLRKSDPELFKVRLREWQLEEFGKAIETKTNLLVAYATNAQGRVMFGVDNGDGDYYPATSVAPDTFGNPAELQKLLKHVPNLERHVDAATWYWFTNTSQITPKPASPAKEASNTDGDPKTN